MENNVKKRGYITLISTIIISLVLLLAVTTLGERAVLGRFMLLEIERKIVSDKLAAACVQIAAVAIANNPSYTVTTPIPVTVEAGQECEIQSVTPDAGKSVIIARAQVGEAVTNLEVIYDTVGETITLWKELANMP